MIITAAFVCKYTFISRELETHIHCVFAFTMKHQFIETFKFIATLIAQEFIAVDVIVIEEAFALVRTVWNISSWFECFMTLSVLF